MSVPNDFTKLHYYDDPLLISMKEAFLAGGGGVSPAVQNAINTSIDDAVAALPPAIHQASVVLTDADLLDLANTPVQVLAPTEILGYSGAPSKFPILYTALFRWKTFSGAYGNETGTNLKLVYGSDASADCSALIDFDSFQTSGSLLRMVQAGPTAGVNLLNNLEDNGVFVYLASGAGNLTGGNPANELEVLISYQIYDFVLGTLI